MRQFFHYLTLTKQRGKNTATDLAYPKIEKTVPQFLTAAEYESLLATCALAANNQMGLRNLIVIMLLGTLGLRTNAVIALNIQDVDTVAGLLRVREKGESGVAS